MINLDEDDEGKVIKPPYLEKKNSSRILCLHMKHVPGLLREYRSVPTAAQTPGYTALQVI